MTQISRQEVLQIAALARLKLSEEEVSLFQEQLGSILNYFQTLAEVDASSVNEIKLANDKENVLRDDVARPSIPVEDALKNTRLHRDGFFVVPKVLEKS